MPSQMPGAKLRLSQWLDSGRRATPIRDFSERLTSDSVIDSPTALSGYEYLLGALRSRAPGQWSADLLSLSRHFTSGIFLATNTLMKHSSQAEMSIMERMLGDREDQKLDWNEPVVDLFENPNNDDDWPDICEGLTQQLCLTGIALEWNPYWGQLPIPSELYVIPTASALPWPPSPVYPNGSYLIQPYYPYGPFSTIPSYQSAAGARIPAEQIVRIKNVHPILRYDGYSVLTAISRIIDTIESVDLARWTAQQKGIEPSIAMTFDPEFLKPDQFDLVRIRKQIEAAAAGPTNAGKILFNPIGGDVKKISNTPAEMAWERGWEQLMSFQLACFGVPKAIAGLSDDASYSTLYATMKQFNILSLNHLLGKIARTNTKHIIKPFFGRQLYMKLVPERIDDRDLLEKNLATNHQVGLTTIDEERRMRGLPPDPDPEFGKMRAAAGVAQTLLQMESQKQQQEFQLQVQQMQMQQQLAAGKEKDKMREREQPNQKNRHRYNDQSASPNGSSDVEKQSRRMTDEGRKGPGLVGSLGRRKNFNGNPNRLADLLEQAKTNGSALPIDDSDGAASYLKQLNGRK